MGQDRIITDLDRFFAHVHITLITLITLITAPIIGKRQSHKHFQIKEALNLRLLLFEMAICHYSSSSTRYACS